MHVITRIPADDLYEAQRMAQFAERAGFDGVITAETKHDGFMPLAAAAMVTDRIGLATAVAMAFPRSPTLMAHQAWDVNKISDGRFSLGIGSQVKTHNERRFGLEWSSPAPRMRDYVGAVRAVWEAWETKGTLDFHSDTYNLTLVTPNFSPDPTGLPPIPVTMGAVGAGMLRIAGEVCDGVRLHPFSTKRYLAEVSIPQIETGLARSGRQRSDIEVVAGGYGYIGTGGTEEEIEKARAFARFRIAFYCSTTTYWDVLRLDDMQWLGERVNPLPRQGRWDEMAGMIPDEEIDRFATVASYEDLPAAVEKRYGGYADTVLLQVTADADLDRLSACIAAIQQIPSPYHDRVKVPA